jgi:hypothetical protein
MWKKSSVGFWQRIQDEFGIQFVRNLPHPPCPHACEPFQLDVLKIAGRYYPEPLVQRYRPSRPSPARGHSCRCPTGSY